MYIAFVNEHKHMSRTIRTESKFNPKTEKGTYSHVVRHGELVYGSKINNDAPEAINLDLANNNSALRLLYDRYNKNR